MRLELPILKFIARLVVCAMRPRFCLYLAGFTLLALAATGFYYNSRYEQVAYSVGGFWWLKNADNIFHLLFGTMIVNIANFFPRYIFKSALAMLAAILFYLGITAATGSETGRTAFEQAQIVLDISLSLISFLVIWNRTSDEKCREVFRRFEL